MQLRVFVGLGNPGPAYRATRHNAGFMVIDTVAAELGVTLRRPLLRNYRIARCAGRFSSSVILLEPLTYMNRSGEVLPSILRRAAARAEEVAVVCDQLDLPTGIIRIKRGGSSGGHRGLKSVSEAIGSNAFVRIYVGIGKPASRSAIKSAIVDYVLSAPEGAELERLHAGVRLGAAAVLRLLDSPVEEAMNAFNRRGTQPC